jgi:hypothetical protein
MVNERKEIKIFVNECKELSKEQLKQILDAKKPELKEHHKELTK